VKQSKSSQDQIPASVLINAGPVDLNISKSAPAPSPDEVARRAYTIYEKQGSQPGHEVKHWLEAEAQLFGGVERESKMRPGSSLFITEH
jgi:Protein of unknown function (DUF2934)